MCYVACSPALPALFESCLITSHRAETLLKEELIKYHNDKFALQRKLCIFHVMWMTKFDGVGCNS